MYHNWQHQLLSIHFECFEIRMIVLYVERLYVRKGWEYNKSQPLHIKTTKKLEWFSYFHVYTVMFYSIVHNTESFSFRILPYFHPPEVVMKNCASQITSKPQILLTPENVLFFDIFLEHSRKLLTENFLVEGF